MSKNLNIKSFWPHVCLMLGAAFLIVTASLKYGPGLAPDTAVYFQTAADIPQGRGLWAEPINPLHPPLYPLVLALLSLSGLSLSAAAVLLNSLLLGLGAALSFAWLREQTKVWWLTIFFPVLILFSASFLHVYRFAWSEPLFITLGLTALYCLKHSMEKQRMALFYLSIICTALATLTRYAGITLSVTAALFLLTRPGLFTGTKRLGLALRYLIFANLPLLLLLARNYFFTHSLTGPRFASQVSLLTNIYRIIDAVSLWFLPDIVPAAGRITVVILIFVLLAALGLRFNTGGKPAGPSKWSIHYLFLAVYLVYITVLASIIHFDVIQNRLLAPLYFSLLFVLFDLAGRIIVHYKSRIAKISLFVGLSAWSLTVTIFGIYLLGQCLSGGAGGYNQTLWREAKIITYLNCHEISAMLYSNEPYAVRLLTGYHTVYDTLWKPELDPQEAGRQLLYFRDHLEHGPIYLIWFNIIDHPYLRSKVDLGALFTLRPIAEFTDGVLYQVEVK